MSNRIPDYLKLHVEEPREEPVFAGLDHLCRSFQRVTGWQLRCASPAVPAAQLTFPWIEATELGKLVTVTEASGQTSPGRKAVDRDEAMQLAAALNGLLSRFYRTRHALRLREAELAAGVPVVSRADEPRHLADRLEAVLRGGVAALGCRAAGLYLLDEGTSHLKLRAHWGLSPQSFLEPPRPLPEAVADLESLLGHAIVIENVRQTHWTIPHPCESALCVPVSSPTVILGTLWLFCDQVRDFSAEETNLAEIIAGRLAADLERSVLMQEVTLLSRLRRRAERDGERRPQRCTRVAPLIDGWKVAGASVENITGGFFYWRMMADDRLAVSLGSVEDGLADRSDSTIAFESALQAHMCHVDEAERLLAMMNDSLWSGSCGDQRACLMHAVVEPRTGNLTYAMAGPIHAYILRPHAWEPLEKNPQMLGAQAEPCFTDHQQTLAPGDVLLALTNPPAVSGPESRGFDANGVAEALLRQTHLSARQLAEKGRDLLVSAAESGPCGNPAVLVVRRDEQTAT